VFLNLTEAKPLVCVSYMYMPGFLCFFERFFAIFWHNLKVSDSLKVLGRLCRLR